MPLPIRTLFYLDPKLKSYAEINALVRLIGLPTTNNPTVASIHITAQPVADKICFIASDHFASAGKNSFFDQIAITKLFQYQYDTRLAQIEKYSVPAPLDGLAKNKIIHTFVTNLFKLALTNNLPISWLWFFPAGARGVLNYRVDVDDNENNSLNILLEQIKPFASWCSLFFTTQNFVADSEPIQRVQSWGAEIGSHAHHHYTFERDGGSSAKNARASFQFFKQKNIPIQGYTTPSSKHFSGIGQLLATAELNYTSNFGMLHDSLPLEIKDGAHNYLEIPIHPICPGNFLKEKSLATISNDTLLNYYQRAARTLAAAYLPIFVYGHNNDNLGFSYLPEFLQTVSSEFPEHARLTMGQYANFWKNRLNSLSAFADNQACDNVAVILPERPEVITIFDAEKPIREYPFSLDTFLRPPLQLSPYQSCPKPTRLSRLMSRHELELILPINSIDPRSLAGIKKIIFKSLYAIYKQSKRVGQFVQAKSSPPKIVANNSSLQIAILGNNVPYVCRTALQLAAAGFVVVGIICPQNGKTIGKRLFLLNLIEQIFTTLIHWCESVAARTIPFDYRYPTFQNIKRLIPNCQFLFVNNHNEAAVAEWLLANKIAVGILAGTGIIKEPILKSARLGFLNAHSALLPKYRGAKSEFWMMLNQDFEHLGVTVHWVTPGLDQGNIIVQKRIFFTAGDTPESLRAKTSAAATALFVEALQLIAHDTSAATGQPQDESQATQYSRPKPADWERLRAIYPYLH